MSEKADLSLMLPDEVWSYMLLQRPIREIASFRLICRRFSGIANEENLWAAVLKRDFGVQIEDPREARAKYLLLYSVIYIVGGIEDEDEDEEYSDDDDNDDDEREYPVVRRFTAERGCETLASLPEELYAAACTMKNGRIYVACGSSTEPTDTTVSCYDIGTNTWLPLPPLPSGRKNPIVAAVGRYLYVIGGRGETGVRATVFRLDTTSPMEWTRMDKMPTNRCGAASAVFDDKIYIMGGGDKARRFNTVECYDPASDMWATRAPMLQAVGAAGCAVLGDYIYVAGGDGVSACYNMLQRYDVRNNKWEQMAPMPSARSEMAVCASHGKLYVIGGVSDELESLDTIECYDPSTNSWTQLKQKLAVCRWGLGACARE